jgi:hypothetical protein
MVDDDISNHLEDEVIDVDTLGLESDLELDPIVE